MEINVLVDEGFEECVDSSWLEGVVEKILAVQGVDSETEVGLVITGQERVRQLNFDYLGENEPTDVLSFAMLPEQPGEKLASFVAPPDGIRHLGEVIISYPQAVVQAGEHYHPVAREITVLIIHGILHLLGYDHDEPGREREMKAREAEILSNFEGETN
ncbi:rRNA maturation RNase YbeY [Chloroflexota bacterium]